MQMFELIEERILPDYNGKGKLYRHDKTGMEIFRIDNEDKELFFSYVFRTPCVNDSGVSHIAEHSVLAGSGKYPVRDPFMALSKGSVSSYLNAITFPDMTLYPGASTLYKDFVNILSVYTDAVFSPLLRKETFAQEGIRVNVENGIPKKFDGVVFNEVQGDAFSKSAILSEASIHALYGGTAYEFDSGGEPTAVACLKYDEFCAFVSKYYRPQNCRLLLYGNLGDLDFGFLDEYLNKFTDAERPDFSRVKNEPERWTAPRKKTCFCAFDDGDDSKSSVTLNWLTYTNIADNLEYIAVNTLVDILLGNPAAPLYKAIIESGIGDDLCTQSGTDTSFPYMPFTVGFDGIDSERAGEAEEFILRTIENICDTGLDKQDIDNAIKQQLFKLKEIPGGIPNGLRALLKCLRTWLFGGSPFDTVLLSEPVKLLTDALEKNNRYFEDWMRKNLLENPHRLLLTVTPHEKFLTEIDDKLRRMLPPASDELTKAAAAFEKYSHEPDKPEDLKKIPTLVKDDLAYGFNKEVFAAEKHSLATVYRTHLFANGIVYVNCAIDISDFDEQDLKAVSLFTRLLQMCGTKKRDYVEESKYLRSLTVALNIGQDVFKRANSEAYSDVLTVSFKCLEEDLGEALAAVGELLREADLKDIGRIKAMIEDAEGDYRIYVPEGGHIFAAFACSAGFSSTMRDTEAMNGLEGWLFAREAKKNPEKLCGIFERIRERISEMRRLTVHFTGEKDYSAEPLLRYFEEKACGEVVRCSRWKDNSPVLHKGYSVPGTVAYNAAVARCSEIGDPLSSCQSLYMSLLTNGYLWDKVRVAAGAYGVSARVDFLEGLIIMSSYRDPCIEKTLNTFCEALAFVPDRKEAELAVISSLSSDLRPKSPSERSNIAFRRIMNGITDEMRLARRVQLLNCDASELIAEAIKSLGEVSFSYATLASSDMLKKAKVDNITKLPF